MSHTPTVTVAKNAGFCFGVARATKAVESEMANHPAGERIFTLGRLIHNEDYNRRLTTSLTGKLAMLLGAEPIPAIAGGN